MKLPFPIMTIILMMCARAMCQAEPNPMARSFVLTPAAPPVPALKYQFLYDEQTGLLPGNAAPIYLDAILLMGSDLPEQGEKAVAAYFAGNKGEFDRLAEPLGRSPAPMVYVELQQAGIRDECDWNAPVREMGAATLLPHLSPLRRMGWVLEARALRQAEQGQIDDALATLRLGYEMAERIPTDRIVISGLVSLVITRAMDDALVEIMNRPDAPNLYWALAAIPSRHAIMGNVLLGERQWRLSVDNWRQAITGQDLTADQWRGLLLQITEATKGLNSGVPEIVNPIMQTSPQMLQKARAEYAESHHLLDNLVDQLDPAIPIGWYYIGQYRRVSDDTYKLANLPYPVLIQRAREVDEEIHRLQAEELANPFLALLPIISKFMDRFGVTDRELAALTAVEAIRSYAATNGGQLPGTLDAVTDTPVPENPLTGKAFEYHLNGDGSATLADTHSAERMTYKIAIRK